MGDQVCCVPQDGVDVVAREARVCGEEVRLRGALGQLAEDALDRDARSTHDGLAVEDGGVELDSVGRHGEEPAAIVPPGSGDGEQSSTLRPARITSAAAILRRELAARGWTQRDLAEVMGRPQQAISEIVRGSKRITAETDLELAAAPSGDAAGREPAARCSVGEGAGRGRRGIGPTPAGTWLWRLREWFLRRERS